LDLTGFLLVAGHGTRIRPLSLLKPKALFPVAGKPLVERLIEHLSLEGLRNFILNPFRFQPGFVAALGDGSRLGVRIEYSFEDVLLGTGGALHGAREMILSRGDGGPLVVCVGDVLTDIPLAAALEHHQRWGAEGTMLLLRRPSAPGEAVSLEPSGRVGLLPGEGAGDFIHSGVLILERAAVLLIEDGQATLLSLLRSLRERGTLYGIETAGQTWDVGTHEGYLDAVASALSAGSVDGAGDPYVAPDAWMAAGAVAGRGCAVETGSRVGEESRLERTVVWPGSRIGPGCELADCLVAGAVTAGTRARRAIFA